MQNTLIDAGPIIALFNKNDKFHHQIKAFLKDYQGFLTTTWPVVTEVSHMLSFNVQTQIDFLTWIKLGGVLIEEIHAKDIERIIELSKKYSDVPMDLADSSLIVIAELTGINEIISIDKDYYIYRTKTRKALNNLLLDYLNNGTN